MKFLKSIIEFFQSIKVKKLFTPSWQLVAEETTDQATEDVFEQDEYIPKAQSETIPEEGPLLETDEPISKIRFPKIKIGFKMPRINFKLCGAFIALIVILAILYFNQVSIQDRLEEMDSSFKATVETLHSADSANTAAIKETTTAVGRAIADEANARIYADEELQNDANSARDLANRAKKKAVEVENQLAAKADAQTVNQIIKQTEVLEKKISDPNLMANIAKANVLDSLKQTQLQIAGLNKQVSSDSAKIAKLDTTIVRTTDQVAKHDIAIANIKNTVATDTARLTAVEAQLAKVNVQTDFLIFREATRYAQSSATIKHLAFDPKLVQKFINASINERNKMWEDLEK